MEGRREAVMDKIDWILLVVIWGLTLLMFGVGGMIAYEGNRRLGLLGVLFGVWNTYVGIQITKKIWGQKNG